MIQTIKNIISFCLYAATVVIVASNLVNYFYCFKYLGDVTLQWKVAMISIAISMLLMSLYIWLQETLKKNKLRIVVSGWTALFLLINAIGVIAGYNLHTKGFMAILLVTVVFGSGHFIIKAWQR